MERGTADDWAIIGSHFPVFGSGLEDEPEAPLPEAMPRDVGEERLAARVREGAVDRGARVRAQRAIGVERTLHHPERVRARVAMDVHAAEPRRVRADRARQLVRAVATLVGPRLERARGVENHRDGVAADEAEQRRERRRSR